MIFDRIKNLITTNEEKDNKSIEVEISYEQHAEKEACMTICECKSIISVGARFII